MGCPGGWWSFSPRAHRKRKRSQLFTMLGDVEFADDTVTCASASYAPAVEQLFDATLHDWSQRRNAHKTERLLVVPNAPRVPVGEPVAGCSESRPRVSVVRHVGGCCRLMVDTIMIPAIGSVGHDVWWVCWPDLGHEVRKTAAVVLLLLLFLLGSVL